MKAPDPDPRCPRAVLTWQYLEAAFLVASIAAALAALPFVPGDLAALLHRTLAYFVTVTWAGAVFVQPFPALSLPPFRRTWPGEPAGVAAIVALAASESGGPSAVPLVAYALGWLYLRTLGRRRLSRGFGCSV